MPKWQPPRELRLINVLWDLCHQCPCCPQWATADPCHPGDPLRLVGRSSPGSYGVTALFCVPVYVKPYVHPPSVESLFPPVLWSSCTRALLAFKAKCSGGSSSRGQTLRLGSLTWGSGLSLLCENLCNIIIFQFVGPPSGGYTIWLCRESAPPTILLWLLLCLWM